MADRNQILPEELIRRKFGSSIDFEKIDQLIDGRQAYDLLWARALRCACRLNTQSDQPDPTCTVCGGSGVRYVHPDPENWPEYCAADGAVTASAGLPIRGLLDDPSLDPKFFDRPGVWQSGRARLTVKGSIRIGYFDRLTMVDAEVLFDQVLTMGAATVTVGRDAKTQLRYPIIDVDACHDLVSRFRLRTDFTVDSSGQLVWVTGHGPATGAPYSIRYSYHPAWVVIGYPRMLSGAQLASKRSRGQLAADEYRPLPISCTVAMDFLED